MTTRVLFVDHSAALSGAELYLLGILSRARAVDPAVLLFEDGPLAGQLESIGVPTTVCPMSGPLRELARTGSAAGATLSAVRGLPSFGTRLRRALSASGAEVIYTNSAKAHVVVAPLAPLARTPVLMHVHDRVVPDSYNRPNRVALHVAAATARTVVANSEETRASLRARERARAHVVPCPVHVGSWQPPRTTRANRLSMALVGRISPWKGHTLAIEAMHRALVAADGEALDLELHVYGEAQFARDVAYGEQARALAEERGLAARVHWHGHVDDVPAAMRRHDLVLHTSTQPEPFGQVIAEAMASGVPVLAADRGGPLEIIDHGRSGWLYPMGQVEGLAASLETLARDPRLRHDLAVAGHRRAQDFAYENVVPRWENLLTDTARAHADTTHEASRVV